MKKSRYTEEQIAFALKQADTGKPVAEVLRRMDLFIRTIGLPRATTKIGLANLVYNL